MFNSVFTNGMMCHVTKATQKLSSHALLVCQQSVTSWFRRKRSDERGKKLQASWQRCGAAERCAGEFCMQQCVEARSGGRKRLRRVRGVHTNCCGATNGGCDGSGVALIETLSSAGCTRGRVGPPPEAQAALFAKRASVLSKVPRLRFKVKRSVMRRDANKPCAVKNGWCV